MRFDFTTCPGYCETIRKQMILTSHPIHNKRHEDKGPAWRSPDEAYVILCDQKEDLLHGIALMTAKLAETDAELFNLRDCAPKVKP